MEKVGQPLVKERDKPLDQIGAHRREIYYEQQHQNVCDQRRNIKALILEP
jgi:hypothetical protein